ncbi:ADENINE PHOSPHORIBOSYL TRANSFERASE PHOSPHORIBOSYLTRANSFERASE-LIKE PROTEIN-RELATED [Salix koriyanagi]|uniref:adenine phosphoribosyltransferase n=1 Tax=Salix koriyanagi TaxID=2511006 RepID=A0A9Q0Z5Q1_9ROSI|nr:ADENINE PHOSPHORIBOSYL TRANSFERASE PHOSPHORIBOSYLTRANSFERASE-LIKE PROTEIN-RELATED [Salix koriyanagi]
MIRVFSWSDPRLGIKEIQHTSNIINTAWTKLPSFKAKPIYLAARSAAASPPPVTQSRLTFSRNYRTAPNRLRSSVSESQWKQDREMATGDELQDPRIARISSAIRVIPDFPKPGIMFQDITTMLLDTKAFKDTIDLFVERYRDKNISVVAGVEARAKFVPMRKPNKLPGEVISEEYSLEYGTDKMEMHVGAVEAGERALVIDDLIATGGTLCAAVKLLERVGVNVVECACVIELLGLKGRERLGDRPLFVLVNAT